MPVSVHLPTRIRVDAKALLEREDAVFDALLAGLSRAVAESRDVVLEPRGRYVRPQLALPDISWGGAGLAAIPAAVRERLAARVATTWLDAATGLELPRAGEPDQPLGEPAGEAPDDERYAHAFGLYRIPSFAGGGKEQNVPVSGPGDELGHAPGTRFGAAWVTIPAAQFGDALAAQRQRQGLPEPAAGYIGGIAQVAGEGPTIGVFRMPEGTLALGVLLRGLTQVAYDAERRSWGTEPVELSPEVPYRLSWVADAAGAEAAFTAHYTGVVRALLLENRLPTVSDAEFEARVKERVAVIVKAELAEMQDRRALIALRAGPATYLVKTNVDVPHDLHDLELTAIAELKELPAPGAGAGDGAGEGKGEGAGKGEAEGGQAGDGDGEGGEGDGAAGARPSGFIEAAPGEEARTGGALFPVVPGLLRVTLSCESYLGEPSVEQLGADGERISSLIRQIAFKLQIPECEYAGNFLLNAAAALGVRAEEIARWQTGEAATTTLAPEGQGDVGRLKVATIASPQIQFLRHLAGVVPVISLLDDLIKEAYDAQPGAISGTWHGRSTSWWLRWHYDVVQELGAAVGTLFAATCQVVFVQLLNASHAQIQQRLDGIEGFAKNFEQVVLPQLVDVDELLRMRSILEEAPTIAWMSGDPQWAASVRARYPDVRIATESPVARAGGPAASSWREASASFVSSLTPVSKQPEPDLSDHYELVVQVDGSYRILDKKRRLWDLEGLETAILLKRGSIEAVEPLVKQLVELPEVMERFRDPGTSVKAELSKLLEEMLLKNELIAFRAASDPRYGFNASRIIETERAPTVRGTLYNLQGVHKLAHAQIGEFFRGDGFYAVGIDHLFSAELGKESLAAFFEFTGIVLLSVLCPPAAVVVGIEVAAYHYAEAKESELVYESLIDPELVKSRAEIEAQLFAAELGLALSFLPVAGEILGEVRAALRVAARGGAEIAEESAAAGARQASVWTAEGMAAHLASTLERGLVEKFAEELAKAWLINKAIELAVSPLMESLQRQVIATGPTGGMEGALNTVLARMVAKRVERERKAAAGATP